LDKKDIVDRNKKEEKERKNDHYKQLNRIEEKKNVQSLKRKILKDTKKKSKQKKNKRKSQQNTEKGFQ
jgi:hypothetical protein